ncbi:hypothetical protein [uncultured Methanolobus sp.]|uniref:hypothetical protein n=1 Tax=uncultured Methanolobus sp. TaxID=218300 RepID=UPI002AABB001|nr:hypothetical protein [uncultured Methanolobus sp.]
MAVDDGSIRSASKHYQEIPYETSLRYHLKKRSLEELIQVTAIPTWNLKGSCRS